MIILFLCKKDFASCSRCVSLNPQWPLSVMDGKQEDHPGFGWRVWGVKGCSRPSGYQTSVALSASAKALGHAHELLCPPGSCRSSPVDGFRVPRRIAASAKAVGNPAPSWATCCPGTRLNPAESTQRGSCFTPRASCLFMVMHRTTVRICYLTAKYLSFDIVLV